VIAGSKGPALPQDQPWSGQVTSPGSPGGDRRGDAGGSANEESGPRRPEGGRCRYGTCRRRCGGGFLIDKSRREGYELVLRHTETGKEKVVEII
jgi:hypothetical protein